MLEVRPPLLRRAIDEADHVDPVLVVLRELLRDQLPDVAGTDDDRVLDVADVAAGQRARRRPAKRDRAHGDRPEHDQAAQVEVVDAGELRGGKEEPGADVTRWKTPTTSSTVLWFVRSSSCS